MYYFYILYSPTLDGYYIGHTSNIEERIRKHNTKHKGFTGKANDWRLVYKEQYKNKSHAYKRERIVKAWKNRNKIEALINSK
jgi:putative endonuclease